MAHQLAPRSSRQRRHHFSTLIAAIGMLVATLAALAPSGAQAAVPRDLSTSTAARTAIGCAPYTWGSLCHELYGSGTRIDAQNAVFNSTSSFCNWRIDFVYFDTAGKEWYRDRGSNNASCSRTGRRLRGTGSARYGKACVHLYKNYTTYVASQCHNITR